MYIYPIEAVEETSYDFLIIYTKIFESLDEVFLGHLPIRRCVLSESGNLVGSVRVV